MSVQRVAILEKPHTGFHAEGSHSGLVRPPAKRVGGVEPPRGFESRTLRHFTFTLSPDSQAAIADRSQCFYCRQCGQITGFRVVFVRHVLEFEREIPCLTLH